MKKTTTYILTFIVCVLLLGCNDNDYISAEDVTQQKIDRLESKLDSLNDSYDEKSQEYDALCKKIDSTNTELAQLEKDKSRLEELIESLQAEYTDAEKSAIKSAEDKIAEAENTLEELNSTISQKNNELAEIEQNITLKQDALSKVEEGISELDKIVKDYEESISTLDNTLKELENRADAIMSTFTIAPGNYIVGEDLPAGKYNLTALSGMGNVIGDIDSLTLGLNIIMATAEESYGLGTETYSGLRLKNGDSFEVMGTVKIRFDRVK